VKNNSEGEHNILSPLFWTVDNLLFKRRGSVREHIDVYMHQHK